MKLKFYTNHKDKDRVSISIGGSISFKKLFAEELKFDCETWSIGIDEEEIPTKHVYFFRGKGFELKKINGGWKIKAKIVFESLKVNLPNKLVVEKYKEGFRLIL